MEEVCPRCNQIFKCLSEQIEVCACSKIKISKEVYEWVSKKYSECLCVQCLMELEEEKEKLQDDQ